MFVGYFYDKHVKVYMQLKFFSRTPSCVMYVCMYVCMYENNSCSRFEVFVLCSQKTFKYIYSIEIM